MSARKRERVARSQSNPSSKSESSDGDHVVQGELKKTKVDVTNVIIVEKMVGSELN